MVVISEDTKRLTRQRVDLYHDDYDLAIEQHGMKCIWERAVVCQCCTGQTGQADFSCPYCHGRGFRYLPGKEIRVLTTSFSSSTKLETLGMREPGSAYATPTRDVIMGYRDRLIFPEFSSIFSESILIRGGESFSDFTKREMKEVLYLTHDNLLLEPEIDFTIHTNKRQIFLLNEESSPKQDSNYSILYYTPPSYLVTDCLHELRATYTMRKVDQETFVELPKQYYIQREGFQYQQDEPMPRREGSLIQME